MPCTYLAPNGQPSIMFNNLFEHYKSEYKDDAAAEKQAARTWIRTHTEAFRNWFGDSKVVDGNGEPLVVYHGTGSKITKFEKQGLNQGLGIYTTARKGYADHYRRVRSFDDVGGKGETMPLFIRIANPKYVSAEDGYGEEVANIKKQPEGHDGIIMDTDGEIIAFDPNQVKSVDNIGAYSLQEDNIYAMRGYDEPASMYEGSTFTQTAGDNDFFSMRQYSESDLRSGKKKISIRPGYHISGVYSLGKDYYRVTNRGFKYISDLKENPATLKAKSIGDDDIQYAHIEEFYKGRAGMYIYDIVKLDESEYNKVHGMTDYVGNMRVTAREPEEDLTSGNNTFDKYISATKDYTSRLVQERKRLRGNRAKQAEYQKRIDEQKELLKQLVSTKSIRVLVDSGKQQVADTATYALREDADFIEITEGLRITNAWKEVIEFLDYDSEETKTEMELAILRDAEKVAGDAAKLYSKIWNKLMQKVIAEGGKRGIDMSTIISKGGFAMKDKDRIATDVLSVAYSTNSLEQLLDTVLDDSKSDRDHEHHDWLAERNQQLVDKLGSLSAKALFMNEEYEMDALDADGKPVKVKRMGILSKFDRAFEADYYERLNKAKTSGKWKVFYKFENEHFKYELSDAGKADYAAYMEQVRADNTILNTTTGEYETDQVEVNKQEKLFNPETFDRYINHGVGEPNRGGTFFTKTPTNVKLNPAWEKLTAKEKEFHAWFTETFAKHHYDIVLDYKLGEFDMDTFLLGFATGMDKPGMVSHMVDATKDFFKNIYSVVGEPIGSKVVTRPLTGQKHIAPVHKNIADFLPDHKADLNPVKVLTDYIASSIAYKHKSDVEELLNLINDIPQLAKKIVETNSNNIAKQPSGETMEVGNPKNIANRVAGAVRAHLTDTARDPNKTAATLSPGERGFSWPQIFDSVNNFTRFRYMAFSPLSGAGNLLMGVMNNTIYAASGKYFTDKELLKSTFMMRGQPLKFITDNLTGKRIDWASDDTKMISDLMYRENFIGDVTEELVYGESAWNKAFILQKGGEFLVQGTSAIAQMLHIPVWYKKADGTLHEGTLKDGYKWDEIKGTTFDTESLADDSPFRDPAVLRKAIRKIKLVNQKIHGDYSGNLAGKATVTGRMLFTFRTWMPMAIKERFGAYYVHDVLGEEKGRYRSVAALARDSFKRKGGKWFEDSKAPDLLRMFARILLPMSRKFIQFSDQVSDIDKENINMFIRETQLLLIMVAAGMAAKAAASDDDDDTADMSLYKYISNQASRLSGELSMFYMPSSWTQIMQSVVPMTSTLTDAQKMVTAYMHRVADPEGDIYLIGHRKDLHKSTTALYRFWPGVRSIETTWSSFHQLYNLNRSAR